MRMLQTNFVSLKFQNNFKETGLMYGEIVTDFPKQEMGSNKFSPVFCLQRYSFNRSSLSLPKMFLSLAM